jgi:hypothetical protein
MDELFKLLESFLGHLKTQMELFAELLPILDEEEQLLCEKINLFNKRLGLKKNV